MACWGEARGWLSCGLKVEDQSSNHREAAWPQLGGQAVNFPPCSPVPWSWGREYGESMALASPAQRGPSTSPITPGWGTHCSDGDTACLSS